MTRKILLQHRRSPGDIVTMTALVRDIQRTYPGEFLVDVDTPIKDIWRHNPYITRFDRKKEADLEVYRLSYGDSIPRAGKQAIHFLTAWHADFFKQTGIKVPLTEPKPDLHLTAEEKDEKLISGRYWAVVAGGKLDFTTKHWSYVRHQQVVDILRYLGIPVVQLGAKDKGIAGVAPPHYHPELQGVLDLVGRTRFRDFMRLIYQADGVICTITAAMHVAAAFDRPCVVTAGGREEWWWEGYVNPPVSFGEHSRLVLTPHRYLHTLGQLPCCLERGCWKSKVHPYEPDQHKSYCKKTVVAEGGQILPFCLDMIRVEHVVAAVLSYYLDGTLPLPEAWVRAIFKNAWEDAMQAKSALPLLEAIRLQNPEARGVEFSWQDGQGQKHYLRLELEPPSQTQAPGTEPATASDKPAMGLVAGRLYPLELPPPPEKSLELTGKLEKEHPKDGTDGKDVKPEDEDKLFDDNIPEGQATGTTLIARSPIKTAEEYFVYPTGGSNPALPVVTSGKSERWIDHPVVGGKVTIFVLMYGDYHDLHRRCLDSICNTTPAEKVEIRVATNAVCTATLDYLQTMQNLGRVRLHYYHKENAKKYPVMREMFWDEKNPIETKWLIWFDDDTICDRNPNWLELLCEQIATYYPQGYHMFGAHFFYTLTDNQPQWLKEGTWYRGLPFRDKSGKPDPVNGNRVHFCTGSFWALWREAIYICDIPDRRLGHNGGDWVIGEQLYQNGLRIKNWNASKSIVNWSSVPRRGLSEKHPGKK